jgi:hypothetical protein
MEPRSHGRQKCHAAVKERPFRATSRLTCSEPSPVGTEEPPHLEKIAASLPALAKNADPALSAPEGTQDLTRPEENGLGSVRTTQRDKACSDVEERRFRAASEAEEMEPSPVGTAEAPRESEIKRIGSIATRPCKERKDGAPPVV